MNSTPPRRRRRRVAVALAIAATGSVCSLPPTEASYTASTTNGPATFGTTALVAPTGMSCSWSGANTLAVSWVNTNGSVATGHQIERSNSTSSGFSVLGTTSPAGTVTFTDPNPAPTALRYYRVAATVGAWTSAPAPEIVSNTCDRSIVAFAGGGATTACSYTGPATALALGFLQTATFGNPSSSAALATDASGNLYVADTTNNCIRKIDPTGTVTPVAGGGATTTCGTTTATNVQLVNPQGVTVDASGNVYVADSGNNCIRKIDTSGNVTGLAGGGATTTCGTTTATNVSLATPTGIAVDTSGNVYIGDNGNRCVRKIDTSGNVTAELGTGNTGSGCSTTATPPTSVALAMTDQIVTDAAGNVYVADGGYSCIYKINGTTVTKLLGASGPSQTSCTAPTDPATGVYNAAYPAGIAITTSGDLYFTLSQDSGGQDRACIVKLTGSTPTLIAGADATGNTGNNGPATAALFNRPTSLALTPTGNLYVTDITDQTIRKLIIP